MAGKREGNLKGAKTKKKKYGDGFFAKIGKIGGSKGWADSGVIKGPKKRIVPPTRLKK